MENCLSPLVCLNDVCQATGDDDDDDDDDSGDGDGDTKDPGNCTPGDWGCECDAGQCNDDALACIAGQCVEDPCPKGQLTCKCLDSNTCAGNLDCLNGFCVNASAGECLAPYADCFDFDAGKNLDPGCCDGTVCLNYEPDLSSSCSTSCVTHEECVTGCCAPTTQQSTYCFTAKFCDDFGKCINTCQFADDGECDDGGPGSDYELCAFGTDCLDCGGR